jgi:RNA polymerase sigma-70 factor (ECF subfamily)
LDQRARQHWVIANILPHEAEVRGWVRRYVRSLSPADIDDLIQEAYSRLYYVDLDRIAGGRSYFFTVVRNLLNEQTRHARIVPMERLGEIEALRIPSEEPGVERKVAARQELQRLERIVRTLPEQCRRAFEMQKFRGLSVRDIAVAMAISEKTVEKHLAVALAKVIRAMQEEGAEFQPATGANEYVVKSTD